MAPTPPTSGPGTPGYRRPLDEVASGRRPCRSASAWSRPRDGSASRWLVDGSDCRLLGDSTVEALTAQLDAVIAGVCDAPERPLAEIDLVTPEERDRLLGSCNDTARPVPEACIHAALLRAGEAHAGRHRPRLPRPSDELPRARRADEPPRAPPARPRRRARDPGRHPPPPLLRDGGGRPRHAQGRGRLRAPRPHLPGRAHRLHGPRRRAWGSS